VENVFYNEMTQKESTEATGQILTSVQNVLQYEVVCTWRPWHQCIKIQQYGLTSL